MSDSAGNLPVPEGQGGKIIKAATYNIHQCIGADGREDYHRTAAFIRMMDADIIGIQELGSYDERPDAFGSIQIDTIVQLTGMTAVTGPTIHHPSSAYGNCLLTRQRVLAVRRRNIGQPDCEPRGLLDVDLDIEGSPLRVMVTHLGLRGWERRYQIDSILDQLQTGEPQPTILLGDFNEWLVWSRGLKRLRKVFGKPLGRATFPSRFPLLALDRIWMIPHGRVRNWWVVNTPISRMVSDHLPLVAEIEIPEDSLSTGRPHPCRDQI